MQYINKAYLLIGGNVGDRFKYLQQARALIQSTGKITKASSIYETAAWGKTDQASFFNQSLELETTLTAGDLMSALLHIEEQVGRKRAEKYGPRTIDIDILLFNDEVYTTAHISIPHPQLADRRFALVPLAEIAGEKQHPVLKKNISELLLECGDTLRVTKWK